MNPERWQQITAVFEDALQHPASDRERFVAEACKSDDDLRREVQSLLAAHASAGEFIEQPVMTVAVGQSGGTASLAGQTIAHYRVLSLLGSGGMGDVYLAEDTKLGRNVALKFLPDYLAGDEKRARLFSREARAASALNHPNIITVYEIGQAGDRYYIAMEYVDGETLREKIHVEQPPLPKLLNYLQQVAEGLTKAHAAGIVHRDLKPDNIMVTRDGYAKVLDFGLAKLVDLPSSDPSEAKTALMAQTSMPGVVMGTVPYMSPEQASGRASIDHRSDIFSFGCILYEAATGLQAFEGNDALDSMHKIVHAPTPRIVDVDPQLPEGLDRIVRRCLAKDPEKRYHSIKDVAIELEEIQQELTGSGYSRMPANGRAARSTGETAAGPPTAGPAARPAATSEYFLGRVLNHKKALIAVIVIVIAVLGVGGFLLYRAGWFASRRPVAKPLSAFQEKKFTRMTTSGRAIDASISPDGKYMAYLNVDVPGGTAYGSAQASVWIRQLASSRDVKIVEPGEFILRGLVFSVDSNFLYYRVQTKNVPSTLFRISVLGGEPQKVADSVYSPIGFSPDGKRIAFVRNHIPEVGKSNLLIANADGTGEHILATRGPGILFATPNRPTAPAWSPDGKYIACAVGYITGDYSLVAFPEDGGPEQPIGRDRWSYVDALAWRADGGSLLLVGRNAETGNNQIWQVGYPSGETRRVTDNMNEYRGLSLTTDQNTLVVVQGSREASLWLASAGGAGEARAITSGRDKDDGFWGLAWTPEGKLVYESNTLGNRDLWTVDPAKGTPQPLTSNEHQNYYPLVTPDGRRIVFYSDRQDGAGIWKMDIDGRNATPIKTALLQGPPALSPDGRWIIYTAMGKGGLPALFKMSVDGGDAVQLYDQYWQEYPVVSPDGKQIALQYFALRSGTVSLGLMPFEGGEITKLVDPPFRVSAPLHWTPDGQGLAYMDNRGGAGNIWVIPRDGGEPRQLTNFKSDSVFWFEWSPDGKHLALSRGTQITDAVRIDAVK
jgi:serine/threonine protein kinase/Tol biopolymer transport system component